MGSLGDVCLENTRNAVNYWHSVSAEGFYKDAFTSSHTREEYSIHSLDVLPPRLCLDLHGCAQLLASVLLSLAFPGRSRNKSRAWEKWPWPGQAFPHLTLLRCPGRWAEPGLHSSYTFTCTGVKDPRRKTQLRSNQKVGSRMDRL